MATEEQENEEEEKDDNDDDARNGKGGEGRRLRWGEEADDGYGDGGRRRPTMAMTMGGEDRGGRKWILVCILGILVKLISKK